MTQKVARIKLIFAKSFLDTRDYGTTKLNDEMNLAATPRSAWRE